MKAFGFGPLLVTLLIQSFSALSLMAVPVLIPTELGLPRLTPSGIGLYIFCAYAGALLGTLSAGALVDRWGAIRTSQWALMMSAAGLILAALYPGALMLAAFMIGMGYGPITPASSHVLIQTTPAKRLNLVFSIKQTGVPVGVAMSGFFIPPLAVTGWMWTLLILALACMVVVASAGPIQAELDAQTSRRITPASLDALSVRFFLGQLLEPLVVIWTSKKLRALAAVSFILSGFQIALTSYLVSFLTAGLLMSALAAGSLLALSQVGGIMGRIVWGYLSDHFISPLRMLALLSVVIALAASATSSLMLWPSAASGFFMAVLMFVFGATASGWNGVYLAEVARQAPPGAVSKATSGTLAFTFLGVMIGAPLFGLLVSSPGGFPLAFGFEAVLGLGLAISLFFLARKPSSP